MISMSFLVAFQNFVELCNAISQINLHYDLIMIMCCHCLSKISNTLPWRLDSIF